MRDNIRKLILKIRYDLYAETVANTKDVELLAHMQREYANTDTEQMFEQILDILCDSYGS